MSGYTKLFNSILASTVWSEPDNVRIVWITMLAMANKDGVVEGSIPGLSVFARIPLDQTQVALARLSSPDEFSRSKENDGRRIESIEGGWRLVNHFKYRQQLSADERREYLRVKQAEHRAKKKATSTSVNNVSDKLTESTHTAPAPYTEANTKADPAPRSQGSINKLSSRGGAHTTSAPPPANGNGHNGNGHHEPPKPDARSKRPIFTGQRLTVFEWMFDDCVQVLGPLTDAFQLHDWFFDLDAKAAKASMVIPKRDGGVWLQGQLLAEAKRRGLPIAVADTKPTAGKLTTRMANAVANIRREAT